MTSLVVAVITYCFAPLLYTQPYWLVLLIVAAILVIMELKETLLQFSEKFDNDEFITLAKFLILAEWYFPCCRTNRYRPRSIFPPTGSGWRWWPCREFPM